jgi:hypothetical protein
MSKVHKVKLEKKKQKYTKKTSKAFTKLDLISILEVKIDALQGVVEMLRAL